MMDRYNKSAISKGTIMKTKVLILSLLCVLTVAVNADVVSVNFSKWGEPDLAVDDGYGVEPANNWFELQEGSEPPRQGTNLTTSNGITSTIDFTISGGEWDRFAWAPGGVGWFHTPMGSGLWGYLTLTISDIDDTFPNEYDVIVYVTGWGGWGAYTDGKTTYYCEVEDAMTGELIQCTDTDDSDGIDEGTYVRFNDLSADTATIRIIAQVGGGIGGFQITGSERAMAYSLSPTGVVSRDFDENELTWVSGDVPDDPNLTVNSMDLLYYTKRTEDVTEDDPNFSNPALTTVPGATSPHALMFDYDTTYFWRIDSNVTWDLIDITGNLTETISSLPAVFEVEPRQVPPKVYIEPNGGRTWLDKPISLPTMAKDVDNLLFTWTVTAPATYTGDPSLFLTGTTLLDTGGGVWEATPVFTPTGTDPNILGEYTIMLTANDGPTQGSDTMWITVHQTPCETFEASGGLLLPFDDNDDCVIDLEDAAVWFSGWLEDINPNDPIYTP
jgi:hypothetical protein